MRFKNWLERVCQEAVRQRFDERWDELMQTLGAIGAVVGILIAAVAVIVILKFATTPEKSSD